KNSITKTLNTTTPDGIQYNNLGLLYLQEVTQINHITEEYKGPHNLATHILHKLAKAIHKEIWIPRCQKVANQIQCTPGQRENIDQAQLPTPTNTRSNEDTEKQRTLKRSNAKFKIW
ncbi:3916_t:CDS:1, partial [Scutellospora calospora]